VRGFTYSVLFLTKQILLSLYQIRNSMCIFEVYAQQGKKKKSRICKYTCCKTSTYLCYMVYARMYLLPQHITAQRLLLDFSKAILCCRCYPSEKERKGEDPSVSHAISQINHADRKSYLKRQEKEKVLCVNTSRRKTGNSAQQIRTVSSEKSHIKYYSNHLCVRNLRIMSLLFTNTGPAPAE